MLSSTRLPLELRKRDDLDIHDLHDLAILSRPAGIDASIFGGRKGGRPKGEGPKGGGPKGGRFFFPFSSSHGIVAAVLRTWTTQSALLGFSGW